MDFDFQPRLDGAAIRVEAARPEHYDTLYGIAADPLIWEVHPAHDRWQEPVFRAFFDAAQADQGGLLVRRRDDDRIIGFSRYSVMGAGLGEVEIGWTFLARDHWGGGTNKELKRLMLAHALASFGTAIFHVGVDNIRSRKAMTKIGGQLIDRPHSVVLGGREVVHVVYAITRDSFAAHPYWQD